MVPMAVRSASSASRASDDGGRAVGYEQLTIEQVIALGSLALAVATILMTTRRDRASEESRAAARVV